MWPGYKHSLASQTTCGPVGGSLCPLLCPRAPDIHLSPANSSQLAKRKPPGKFVTYRGVLILASACEAGALPTELIVRALRIYRLTTWTSTRR